MPTKQQPASGCLIYAGSIYSQKVGEEAFISILALNSKALNQFINVAKSIEAVHTFNIQSPDV